MGPLRNTQATNTGLNGPTAQASGRAEERMAANHATSITPGIAARAIIRTAKTARVQAEEGATPAPEAPNTTGNTGTTSPSPEATPKVDTANTVGFIGKSRITDEERELLHELGQCIALAHKTLVIVPFDGATAAVEAGAKAEGGDIRHTPSQVVSNARHTIVYADPRLLARLGATITGNVRDVSVIHDTQTLREWISAAHTVITEKNMT